MRKKLQKKLNRPPNIYGFFGLFFGYPPDSVLKQSIYTGFDEINKKVNNSEEIVEYYRSNLENLGYFVNAKSNLKWVIDSEDFEGSDDLSLFELAQEKKALFLTTDKDFFHTVPYLFKKHYGVIVIALHQPNRQSIIDKLLFALNHIDLSKLQSKVLLLRDNDYSII